jgi:hypothetical protein
MEDMVLSSGHLPGELRVQAQHTAKELRVLVPVRHAQRPRAQALLQRSVPGDMMTLLH